MKVGRFRSGILLIGLGIVLLLYTLDIIGSGFWHRLVDLWPVLLIAIGLEKIFNATDRLKPLALISPVLIVLTFAYAVTSGGGRSVWDESRFSFRSSDSYDTYSWSTQGLTDTDHLSLVLGKDRGRVVIRNGVSGDNLVDGRLRFWEEQPNIKTEDQGNDWKVEVDDRDNDVDSRDLWILKLTDRLPITIRIDGDPSQIRLDGTRLSLDKLMMDTESDDVDITLGTLSAMVDCVLRCGGAAVDLRVPSDAGLSINKSGTVKRLNISEMSLIEQDDRLVTPGFDASPVKIVLNVESELSSLRIHRRDYRDSDGSI